MENFCKKCKFFVKSGEAPINTKFKSIITSYPNEILEFYRIGRIPRKNQYDKKFIFVAIDHYTKRCEAIIIT